MPRDSNGNYTLPSGNPVVTGEVISTGWANPTMSDIGAELTNSLDRQGRGGMLAPFKFVDGTNSQPGMTWTNEPTTGFYRAGGSDMRATVAGVARMRWTGTGVDVYDSTAGTWVALSNASGVNYAVKNAENKFTQQQIVVNTAAAWSLWKDATPTLGGRIGFNIDATDAVSLARFNGTDWIPRWTAGGSNNNHFANNHYFYALNQTLEQMRLTETYALFPLNNFWIGAQFQPTTSVTLSAGAATAAAGSVQLGVFANDGYAGPRAALFASGDGATTGSVGLDWTYSNAIFGFYFRRAGVNIASYNESGFQFLEGRTTAFYDVGANNVSSIGQAGTDLAFNSGAGNAFAFVLSNQKVLNIVTQGPDVYFGKRIRFLNADNSDGGTIYGSGADMLYTASTAQVFFLGGNEKFRIDTSGATLFYGNRLQFVTSDQNTSVNISALRDSFGTTNIVKTGAGGYMHWHPDNGYVGGAIKVQQTDPALTGQPPGTIFLVY